MISSGLLLCRSRRPWVSMIALCVSATCLFLAILPSGVRSMSTLMMANVSLDVAAAPSNLTKSSPGGSSFAHGDFSASTLMLKKPVLFSPVSSLKTFYGNVHQPLHPLHPVAFHPPPPQSLLVGEIGVYGRPLYTRVKLGYGAFYFDGRQAELRCHFPYNLQILSNFVWNKVSDNLMHYLDAYRIVERTFGHSSLLLIRDVIGKDLGIYECAVSGSFYGGYPVTFYQEVHFYPVPTSPRRLQLLSNIA